MHQILSCKCVLSDWSPSHECPQPCCLPRLLCKYRDRMNTYCSFCGSLWCASSACSYLDSHSVMVWIFIFFFPFCFGLCFPLFFFFLTSKLPLNDPKAVKWVRKLPWWQRKPQCPDGVFKLLPLMWQHVQLFKSKAWPLTVTHCFYHIALHLATPPIIIVDTTYSRQ